MCQTKPRRNLRDLIRLAILSCFCSDVSPHLSYSHLFSNQVRSNRGRLSVTAIGCEISEGRACGNHSIGCAHLGQHIYRHASGFWKGEKSFTKSISGVGFIQSDYFMFSHFCLSAFALPVFCTWARSERRVGCGAAFLRLSKNKQIQQIQILADQTVHSRKSMHRKGKNWSPAADDAPPLPSSSSSKFVLCT